MKTGTRAKPHPDELTTFENSIRESVMGRITEAGLVKGPVELHSLERSPDFIVQDLGDETTHVRYTTGAKTCTMLAVWGRVPGTSKRVLAQLHQSGIDAVYDKLPEVGDFFRRQGAEVNTISYSRGELGHTFGELEEDTLIQSLGHDLLGDDFTLEYVPSEEAPVSAGLITEARTGRTITY